MENIELRADRAMEAVNAIEAAVIRGERPTVLVDDLDGLSREFVERLLARDDLDVVLSCDVKSVIQVGDETTPAATDLTYLAFATLVLAAIGVRVMFGS